MRVTTRRFRTAALGAVLAGIAALVYAVLIEPNWLRLRRWRVHVPGLPADLDGVRVVFLTDFHVKGPGRNAAITQRALDVALRARPDVVLLGGDYFDHGDWEEFQGAFNRLRALADRVPVLGVLGNHDMRRGPAVAWRIARVLEERGVTVLRNQVATVRLRGREVLVAGVDDPYLEQAKIPDVVAQIPPGERLLVFLAHAPFAADDLPVGAAGLVLTGHTHGGQIRLSPFARLTPLDISWYLDRLLRRRPSPYQRGWHWVNGMLVLVSVGVGATRWSMRFLSPPEVVVLELTASTPRPDQPCDSPRRYVERIDEPLEGTAGATSK
ncbi:MAG: metallophosphoesterase, partial [Thermomicrobiaceae bacterium]|nr:metallophosphoesterase [Thermomicrobiaceae bacterium]